MPIGVGLGISAAIGAGASIFGAHEAASASKNAAAVQQQSADKALAVEKGIYDNQVAMLSPYVQAGTASMQALMSKYWGTPFNNQIQSYIQGGKAAANAPVPYSLTGAGVSAPAPQPWGAPAPQQPNAFMSAMPAIAAAAPRMAPPMGGGGMVSMVSPDGSETVQVPQNLVSAFQAKGAKLAGPPPQAMAPPMMRQPYAFAG